MKVKDLIKELENCHPDMDVFATDGIYLKEFNLFTYTREEIIDWLEMWDDSMVEPESLNLVFVMES